MATTPTTTIRLEHDLKKEASALAKKLGTNLSTVITLYLKNNFLVEKGLSVNLRDEDGFTAKAAVELKRELYEIAH